jgi:hypothetical protein
MKKLTVEEAADITPIKRGRETEVSKALKQLKIGEGLVITHADWQTAGSPYRVVQNVSKSLGRTFENGKMPDGSGWIVKRLS